MLISYFTLKLKIYDIFSINMNFYNIRFYTWFTRFMIISSLYVLLFMKPH